MLVVAPIDLDAQTITMDEHYNVVVIGGGISGLTAAHHLKKRDPNLRVLVLEAKDRVGGRTQTVALKSRDGTDQWDVGGQWVGRCQPHIMALLLELGLDTHPQFTDGRKVQQLSGPAISYYSGELPSLSIFALLDLNRFINKVDSLRQQVNSADPYACPRAEEWDAITFQHFVQETCFTQGCIDAILVSNRTIFGVETSQISFLFWLTYCSAADGIRKLCEATEYSAQEGTIKGGAQQVSKLLAKRIGLEHVHLGEAVTAIEQDSQGVQVSTAQDMTYTADFAILALPPPLMKNIKFSPELPPMKQQLCRRMGLGNYTKVILTYQEAFWRAAGYSGEVVTNGGVTSVGGCSSGPLCVVYDDCLHSGSPALLAFIGGDNQVEWAQQSAAARKQAVLGQLEDYFGREVHGCLDYVEKDWNQEPFAQSSPPADPTRLASELQPEGQTKAAARKQAVLGQLEDYFGREVHGCLDYVEKDWNQEPFLLGGPVCYMPPGTMPVFSKAIRTPVDRLHFAGTETATVWCGFMSGAVQSGLRAAAEILEIVRPQCLTSEDCGALEASTPATRPQRGLSKPRWLLEPRRGFPGAGFLKWTLGLCALAAVIYGARRARFSRVCSRF